MEHGKLLILLVNHNKWYERFRYCSTAILSDRNAPWKRGRKLPEWTKEHAYTGTVNFGDNIRFDAEI